MAMNSVHFWALEPDAACSAQIVACKAQVRAAVGPQQFLDDPPHVTLYLAAFEASAALEALTTQLAAALAPATVHVRKWHVFATDALTGRDTLVTDFDAADVLALQATQRLVVEILAPHRAVAATRDRYDVNWQNLNETMRYNVLETGFPFVGPIWHPHVTIASIAHAAWPRAWDAVRDNPPVGPVRMSVLKWYRLNNEQLEEMLACPLGASCES